GVPTSHIPLTVAPPAISPLPLHDALPIWQRGSSEHPVSLLVDDLLALAERDGEGVFERGELVGADEAVFLRLAPDLLRDHATALVLAAFLERRGADRKALVVERFARWHLFRSVAAEELAEERHR